LPKNIDDACQIYRLCNQRIGAAASLGDASSNKIDAYWSIGIGTGFNFLGMSLIAKESKEAKPKNSHKNRYFLAPNKMANVVLFPSTKFVPMKIRYGQTINQYTMAIANTLNGSPLPKVAIEEIKLFP
jgi:hypothetical protein